MSVATIPAVELATAARWASRATAPNASPVVLAATVVVVGAGLVTIRGYDYVTSAEATTSADGRLPSFLVHGKMFADVAARLKGDAALSFDGSRLLIESPGQRFHLPMMPMDDYPTAPLPAEPEAAVSGFAEAVSRVATAAATLDGSVPILTGINIEAAAGELILSAIDSYRMTQERLPWSGGDHEARTVPAYRLKELIKELGAHPSLGFGDEGVTVSAGGRSASLGSIDGAFPDPAKLIEGHSRLSEGHLYVVREELIDAVRSTAMFAEKNKPVMLDLSTDAITVSASGVGDGSGESLVEASYEGPDRRIAMQPGFLIDALATTPGPVARLMLPPIAKASGGVVVHACSEMGGEIDQSHAHLVMSLRILQES